MSIVPFLHRVVAGESLNSDEARACMGLILGGEATTAQIAAFLVALRMKGDTGPELLGFAQGMREKAVRIEVGLNGEPLVDTCGTGGDGGGTFNISTAAAFVVAGAGVRVAKHGNRSLTSQCGSADVLEELGVKIAMAPAEAARAIRESGFGFCFAPAIHPAMKHAQPARAEIKLRTVFNLLGPLTNPAGATCQIIGAPSTVAAQLMAEAAAGLGIPQALVVHGTDGLDEITTTGPTLAYRIQQGSVTAMQLTPEDFGLSAALPEDLRGGDKTRNAAMILAILRGQQGAPRDIVLVNAAAALVIAGVASGWLEGMSKAALAIDSGKALSVLEHLINSHL
jgi:anthranilate phosphoribosyltransferase